MNKTFETLVGMPQEIIAEVDKRKKNHCCTRDAKKKDKKKKQTRGASNSRYCAKVYRKVFSRVEKATGKKRKKIRRKKVELCTCMHIEEIACVHHTVKYL